MTSEVTWETLKKNYPGIENIHTQKEAIAWLPKLSPQEQEILQATWGISPIEKNVEIKENTYDKEEKTESTTPINPQEISHTEQTNPIAHEFALLILKIQLQEKEIKERIVKKWKLIREMFPETKSFKTQEQFNDWAPKTSPEQQKDLQKKYDDFNTISIASNFKYKISNDLIREMFPETKSFKTQEQFNDWASKFNDWASKISPEKKYGDFNTISIASTFMYKKISEDQDNISPNSILKLPTSDFHPNISTTTGKPTSEEYRKLSPSAQKSILRHEKKLTKELPKEKNEEDKSPSLLQRFKKKYRYFYHLIFTPKKVAAKKIAGEEYTISEKNTEKKVDNNPAWIATVVGALTVFISPSEPPPGYDSEPPPPGYDVEESGFSPPEPFPDEEKTSTGHTSTSQNSNFKQHLQDLQDRHNNNYSKKSSNASNRKNHTGQKNKRRRNAGRTAAAAEKKTAGNAEKRLMGRCCGCFSCFELFILLFVIFIMVIVLVILFGGR